jgi:hypothetical protein
LVLVDGEQEKNPSHAQTMPSALVPIDVSAMRAFDLWHSPTEFIHCREFELLNPAALIAAAAEADRQYQIRRAEYHQRKALRPATHLTLLVNTKVNSGTKTHITCSTNPIARIQELCNDPVMKQFVPIITLSAFDSRNGLSASAIMHFWKKSFRNPEGRILGGLQLASTYHLDILDHKGGTYLRDLVRKNELSTSFKTRKLPFETHQVMRHTTTLRPRRKRKMGTYGSVAYNARMQIDAAAAAFATTDAAAVNSLSR